MTRKGVIGDNGLRNLPLEAEYRTGANDLVRDFYAPCINRSSRIDRAIGYFRSSVYDLTGEETLNFALRGGRIRLVCSPALDSKDVEAMRKGYADREEYCAQALHREVHSLLASPESHEKARILATLVKHRVLEIRIAFAPESEGIYHEKLGILIDNVEDAVSFKGSANETWRGWSRVGNIESIDVFCSWKEKGEQARVERHQEYFESLWQDTAIGIRTIPLPALAEEALIAVSHPDLTSLEKARSRDSARPLLPHQTNALDAWAQQNRRGILEHATGSGKTLTAIGAIREHAAAGKPSLVLVPSILLLEQWTRELRQELPAVVVLRAGGSHSGWKLEGRLKSMTSANQLIGGRVTVATCMTASSDDFQSRVSQGEHLLIVADEVHSLGSQNHRKVFNIDSGPRLGLSATPRRYGDDEGTEAILEYFGGVVPPPFTLADAIKSGRLVPYQYFPHFIGLSEDEIVEWRTLSDRISKQYAMSQGSSASTKSSEYLKMLLIGRSRIAKKAVGKVDLAVTLLANEYRDGQRWLVYCDDVEQLRLVREQLQQRGVQSLEYHSQMKGDHEGTLQWFRSQGGVLVSVRCLDEGVDIPEVTHALVLASSQNPRQFVQRRGRVLRVAAGKAIAVIHDCLVLPEDQDDTPQLRALSRSELRRADTFSASALNRSAGVDIRRAAIDRNIDFFEPDFDQEDESDE